MRVHRRDGCIFLFIKMLVQFNVAKMCAFEAAILFIEFMTWEHADGMLSGCTLRTHIHADLSSSVVFGTLSNRNQTILQTFYSLISILYN